MPSVLRVTRVLVDTSVWVAEALRHRPASDDVTAMLRACVMQDVDLLYSPSTIKDLFCVLPRQMRMEAVAEGEEGLPSFKPAAWACVRRVMDLATASPLSVAECEMAWMLRGRHADLEDNLIVATAETAGVDYIVTYDRGLIEHYSPVCVTPAELTCLVEGMPPTSRT